jgi:DNA polymerase
MEDIKGEPFVGRAGQLLTKMLAAIDLTREEVFITNVVKCRPPNNRTPQPEEVSTCFTYLEKQIELIDPLIICCLGGPAARTMIGSDAGVSKLRGTIHQYKNYAVIPTYHPAAVLRFPERYKRHVWNDLKLLRDYYKDVKR